MIIFNDTTNRNGLIQLIERNLGLGNGRISGDTELLKDFTADINIAKQELFRIIFKSSGTWQLDDSTHTDYPIITTNLVQNQRDYSFLKDENDNLILDIYKVMVKNSSTGLYYELTPTDMQTDSDNESFYNGNTDTGEPTKYDKTGNGIFLDILPKENITNGLKIFINREGTYYTYTDTTKMTGVDGLCDEFLALQPTYRYAMRKGMQNAEQFKRDLDKLVNDIQIRYRDRKRDEVLRIIPEEVNYI